VLARMIETLADGIDHVRGKGARGLVTKFNQFVTAWDEGAIQHRDSTVFYFVLANIGVARAQLILGSESPASQRLKESADLAEQLDMLDLVDVGASLCTAAEQMPLLSRRPVLASVMQRLQGPREQWFFTPHMAAFGWRLLDQLAEAAVSKDRLTLEVFRHYLDRDERRIRQRILRDF